MLTLPISGPLGHVTLTVPQVGLKPILSFYRFFPGIDCEKLSVLVDQTADGPVYSLQTTLARPTYQEISAVSLVRKSEIGRVRARRPYRKKQIFLHPGLRDAARANFLFSVKK